MTTTESKKLQFVKPAAGPPPQALPDLQKTLAQLEADSAAVEASFAQLLTTTQASLKAITTSAGEQMQVLNRTAKGVGTSVETAIDQTHAYVNKCIELDKELQKLDALESQLAGCKEALTSLEAIVASVVST